MKHPSARKRASTLAALVISFALLAGCASGPLSPEVIMGVPTRTPTPTAAPPPDVQATAGVPYRWVEVDKRACPVAQFDVMLTDQLQGDLLAWSPNSYDLAFIRQRDNLASYTGDLVVARGPDFTTLTQPVFTTHAWGDVTWSPDGAWIAVVAMRSADVHYTVMAARSGDLSMVDLFPGTAAQTDAWSSRKAIVAWDSPTKVQVETSCGLDCFNHVEVDVQGGPLNTLESGVRTKDALGLEIARQAPGEEIAHLPQMSNAHISPTKEWVAYTDETGAFWLLNVPQGIRFELPQDYAPLAETKWSYDGRFLAVRSGPKLTVYQFECK